ncbi:MAG: T9SS type A sorting domain-containing protein [Flavobacteriales bacterium]|nr:T9SS type A sorting domain-containing protein [Flavobacteriales bacterium]
MHRVCAFSLFVLSWFPGLTQADSSLSSFSASVDEGSVLLIWTLEAGSTCNGISVQRSTDLLTFNEIGNIAGICGSDDQPVTYTFSDERPVLNAENHYRLELGQLGYTSTRVVDVSDFSSNKIQIRPNPIAATLVVRIDNARFELLNCSISDLSGKVMDQFSTREDLLNLSASRLPSGIFIFSVVYEDGAVYYSKFAVSR